MRWDFEQVARACALWILWCDDLPEQTYGRQSIQIFLRLLQRLLFPGRKTNLSRKRPQGWKLWKLAGGEAHWTVIRCRKKTVSGIKPFAIPFLLGSLWTGFWNAAGLGGGGGGPGDGDVWCLPLLPIFLNLTAVIWLHFPMSSLALLLSHVALSVLSSFC